jgi:hypothetical protein
MSADPPAPVTAPTSIKVLHVTLQAQAARLVTFDNRLRRVAESQGLFVVPGCARREPRLDRAAS